MRREWGRRWRTCRRSGDRRGLTVSTSNATWHKTSTASNAGSAEQSSASAEELAEVGTGSVYDAIVRRHGQFLKDRGRTSIYGKNIPRAVVFIARREILNAVYFLPSR